VVSNGYSHESDLFDPNTARYLTRPIAPLVAGAAIRSALGLPFLLAGVLKSVYDVGLYLVFRDVPLRGADTRQA